MLPDGRIVWPGPGNQLYLLSPEGRVVSTTRLDGFVLSPAFDSARSILYAQDMSGRLWSFAVTPKALRKRWTLDLGAGSFASAAVTPDGSVRAAAGNDLVAIVDHVNLGAVTWHFPTEDLIEVSPAIGPDGAAVIGSNDPFEYAVNADGSLRWRFRKDSEMYGSPAIHNGNAVFGDHRGRRGVR